MTAPKMPLPSLARRPEKHDEGQHTSATISYGASCKRTEGSTAYGLARSRSAALIERMSVLEAASYSSAARPLAIGAGKTRWNTWPSA